MSRELIGLGQEDHPAAVCAGAVVVVDQPVLVPAPVRVAVDHLPGPVLDVDDEQDPEGRVSRFPNPVVVIAVGGYDVSAVSCELLPVADRVPQMAVERCAVRTRVPLRDHSAVGP